LSAVEAAEDIFTIIEGKSGGMMTPAASKSFYLLRRGFLPISTVLQQTYTAAGNY